MGDVDYAHLGDIQSIFSGRRFTAHNGELSVAKGRVYLGTFDGMLYCYGIAK